MKYIVLLGDGMADEPLEELGGKTPLEAASTPNMDMIAGQGTVGILDTVPPGFPPGSDVANLSVLGYDPRTYYSGRGPLEAANMGVSLGPGDVAFRCNLVTLSEDNPSTMEDYSADHISTAEASEIIKSLERKLGSDQFKFYAGVSYRHLLITRNGLDNLDTTPPHDIVGQDASKRLPKGQGAEKLLALMTASREILKNHPVNIERVRKGKRPANSIWPWGQGRAPKITPLTEIYGIRGGIISAVNLLNGIGKYAGLEVLAVEGTTGYVDTNYEGKAEKAISALARLDFVFVHVEAPDEMGHEGNIKGKIKAIEDFDRRVVGNVLDGVNRFGSYRIMAVTDHPTPIRIKTHSGGPSPFAVLSSAKEENICGGFGFNEASAASSGIRVSPGCLLMGHFIGDWRKLIGEKHS